MSRIDVTTPSQSRAAWIGFLLGPAILLYCLLTPAPASMSEQAWVITGMAFLMAIWWATEAIPIPATALIPILIVPLIGVSNLKAVTSSYAEPTIFLFLGGFVLGLALQRWNLHKRIALVTLLKAGSNPRAQIAGFMGATAFLSMWVSNTATAIMMLPIGLSVINMLTSEKDDPLEKERFATAILLGIAYASSIGGIATLIGTPPNAMLASILSKDHGIELGFGKWMLLGVPIALAMLALAWWWLTFKGFHISGSSQDSRAKLQKELEELGPPTKGEKLVGIVFVLTSLCWIARPFVQDYIKGIDLTMVSSFTSGFLQMLLKVDDTIIAITSAMALFVIPVDVKKREFLIDWHYAQKLPWGVLLLFGGGLALSGAIKTSGLSLWIGETIGAYVGGLPILLLILIIAGVILMLTEVTSNTATAATFIPLMIALIDTNTISPLMVAIPTAIAASCAFMMPVATPPNAIVFGTGLMKIGSMIRSGFFLSATGIFVVTGFCYFLILKIWPYLPSTQ